MSTDHRFDFAQTKTLNSEKFYFRRRTMEAGYFWINSANAVNFRSDLKNVNATYIKNIKIVSNLNEILTDIFHLFRIIVCVFVLIKKEKRKI